MRNAHSLILRPFQAKFRYEEYLFRLNHNRCLKPAQTGLSFVGQEKLSPWPVILSLLMLFISGAWTLAAITPLSPNAARPLVLVTVTAANISSLVTVLAAILLYTDIGPRTEIRKVMVLAFSVGMCSLVLCIMPFSASILIVPPKYCD